MTSDGSRIQLGALTLPYRAHSFERALEGIAACGFRYLGVTNEHAGAPVIAPDASDAQIQAVRRQIEAAGLLPRMTFGFGIPRTSKEEQLRRSVEVAAALGIEHVISTGPGPYVKSLSERKRDMLFRRECDEYFATLRAVAPIAERLGVLITPKPHMGVTGTGADLAELVELIDHASVRICYDAGNIAFYEGLKPEEDVNDCARYVRAVCVKDHRGPRFNRDFPIPGDGDVDHAQVFRSLLGAGFSGPCLVERVNGTERADDMPLQQIDAALAKAKSYLDQAVSQAESASGG